MDETTTDTVTRVATTTVVVTDLPRALAFYVDDLGMRVGRDAELGPGRRWVEVGPAGGGTTIALITAGSGFPPGIRLGTADADSAHDRLRGRCVDVDEQVLRMGDVAPPMFTVRDPDGNVLVLVEGA
ncbi:VOC family protein [Modestobacter marinus]|uniref:Catechol 2,3-dioxygenase-like lactoylglutathione lyase family enzyme n=1 Tax=Modestobacter marinus TaxID=477641 RepID=A0A846LS95_9ACTN|nr:VOC family protein [Modestobacter marinus]NIH68278.1 catechol 2,3-dioxygenase-like lactoylglutathione lyase family enzyme [Modestobacter marinus]GGL55928.1 glyoxalase [Modestobacter marinus]